jgi:shikimate dehydrogenase
MFPDTEKAVIEDADFYQKLHTGYDLVFNPAQTRFMKLVESQGGRAYNGLKMLLYQGIIAYELWTGAEIPAELIGEAYNEMKKAMNIQ